MTDEDLEKVGELLAAGGWCAPSEDLYQLGDPGVAPGPEIYGPFPEITVQRGGIDFNISEEEKIARTAMHDRMRRMAWKLAKRRHAVIERAAVEALRHHWDLHVYEPQEPINLYRMDDRDLARLSYIGIEFRPGDLAIPVIHYHKYDPDYCEACDD